MCVMSSIPQWDLSMIDGGVVYDENNNVIVPAAHYYDENEHIGHDQEYDTLSDDDIDTETDSVSTLDLDDDNTSNHDSHVYSYYDSACDTIGRSLIGRSIGNTLSDLIDDYGWDNDSIHRFLEELFILETQELSGVHHEPDDGSIHPLLQLINISTVIDNYRDNEEFDNVIVIDADTVTNNDFDDNLHYIPIQCESTQYNGHDIHY